MGSNAPIASATIDDPLFCNLDTVDSLRQRLQTWLAPKLGLQQERWPQVTLYFGAQRITPDVLLGAHLLHHGDATRSCYRVSLMPQVNHACRSFMAQLDDATIENTVLHATKCPNADFNAAALLYAYRNGSFNKNCLVPLVKKYGNNVAFMIAAADQWPCSVYELATPVMQKNELFATTAVAALGYKSQPLVCPDLWNKPSFVVRAARNAFYDWSGHINEFRRSTEVVLPFAALIGDAVKADNEAMLRLIRICHSYFSLAAAKNDFDFQCKAVAANWKCLNLLDKHTADRINTKVPNPAQQFVLNIQNTVADTLVHVMDFGLNGAATSSISNNKPCNLMDKWLSLAAFYHTEIKRN